MKSYSWILILVLFLSGFSSCHSDAERYKDILREGSWYVYDIDYSYKLYDDFETPELFDFFHYLLDERNLLFLPGDELMFSKRRIDVNCPDGDRFGYDYYYSGDYIRIGRDGDYMDLFPQGDMNALTLTLDRIGLENLLSYWAPVDEYYAYLLEAAYRNLYDFHITYHLQRPIPEMAQVMPGIYIGPMYDGNQQLMNESATVNLFWEKGQMNMTLDDKVILEDENGPGPQFYVDIAGLQVDKGRTREVMCLPESNRLPIANTDRWKSGSGKGVIMLRGQWLCGWRLSGMKMYMSWISKKEYGNGISRV